MRGRIEKERFDILGVFVGHHVVVGDQKPGRCHESRAVAAATGEDITVAIRHANCLGKATASTRRLTHQRLTELYALDPQVPIYRVLRSLWALDPPARPLLAVTVAIGRDPLLAASAAAVVSLPTGAEFTRGPMKEAIRTATGDRLSDAILDKVVRNTASSWTQ